MLLDSTTMNRVGNAVSDDENSVCCVLKKLRISLPCVDGPGSNAGTNVGGLRGLLVDEESVLNSSAGGENSTS